MYYSYVSKEVLCILRKIDMSLVGLIHRSIVRLSPEVVNAVQSRAATTGCAQIRIGGMNYSVHPVRELGGILCSAHRWRRVIESFVWNPENSFCFRNAVESKHQPSKST